MELKPGDKLGPYEIVSALGKGGMGEVWRARDPRLGRDVAIKVSERQFDWRAEREARAIAALNHPNICQIYDVGPNYLVMEHIDGTPPRGPLLPPDALKLALAIAAGLEAAHEKGITHRDLKPANILVTQSGVKLLDFGLARMSDTDGGDASVTLTVAPGQTMAGTVLGTADYMSPEQAQGKPADPRSDIFSFGLILYELLTGRRAFARDSAIEVMAAIVRDEPEPLSTHPRLSEIISRCLRKAPAARFQTMHEVRLALEQVNVTAADETPSIAVLPFANMSGDKEQEYFSDGLAEEILNLLAKIPGLKVTARTSSFAFRGKEQDITKIAETLRVRTILEGSVRRSGNRIRVTAQLINAADGYHRWSERYDRDMTDVFAVQDEIGQAISEALKVRLAPRTQTMNIEAWQYYLKGRYHHLRLTPDSLAKAKECFERALAIEGNFALAYSGLAVYYYALAVLGMEPAGKVAFLSKSAAEKALAIDPGDSEAHSVLAVLAGVFDYDWKAAEIHHRKAMAAEPVPSMVRWRYANYYLLPMGRFPEVLEQSRLALESDPLSVFFHASMALSLYYARQYGTAMEYARHGMEIDANFHHLWLATGLCQLKAGSAHEAVASFKRVVELAPWWSDAAWLLAAACHVAGDRGQSEELVRKLASSHRHSNGAASYYAASGEVDAMFEALDGACREHDISYRPIQVDPVFDPWRADPRFQALLRRMNLA
jgi:TolB-like protein/tRNA A-37 threonylcarbamoyl transferase component Bud32/Tfp pilus assembly protein PilF